MFWEDPESVVYTIALVVPGYVWTRVEHRFVPRQRIEWSERLIGYTVYTLVNYAIWFLVFLKWLIERTVAQEISIWVVLGWIVVLYLGPALGGFVTGLWAHCDVLGRTMRALRVPATIDPNTPTGWERAFGRSESCVVQVELKNDERILGKMGLCSCASTDPEERDLFLEVVYEEGPNGVLKEKRHSKGVWLPRDEIRCVWFGQLMDAPGEHKHEPRS